VSWRRTTIGGGYALAAFAVLVAGFMVMRAMGIGPIGSLLAAGKLSERDKLLVTDFRGGGADSSLSAIVTEAIRTDLGQSSVVSVVSPSSIADALARMRRDRTSRVDLALAREIAAREGIKGIVDGSVTPLAGGYVVTVRLVEAATGDDFASFRETIDGPKDLIPTLDNLSGQLRGKIGESLKTLRANPPLERVTTSSLEALRKYAAGTRAFEVEGDMSRAVELFREAVAIDTTFAAAYRKLGAALGNMGMPRSSVDSAYRSAYEHRDRLTDVERYLTIGSYFTSGKQRDRNRSADAYEAVLEIDSLNYVASNNLGNILVTRREFARAEAVYRRAIAAGTARATIYTNLLDAQLNQRKFAAAESTAAIGRSRYPANPVFRFIDINMLMARKQLDSLEKRAAALRATAPNEGMRAGATWYLRGVALMRGRISDAARLTNEANAIDAARGAPAKPLERAIDSAWIDTWYREQPARGAQALDAALARVPFRSLPLEDRPYLTMAELYALAGRPDRARALIAERSAEVRDTALLRQEIPATHRALAEIALAEKRPLDALAEFRLSDRLPDGPVTACIRCFLSDIARAHDAAGARDSTIAAMERYLALPSTDFWPDQGYLAQFHRRLGELYDAAGNSGKAIPHYERFVELWKNADPELQPKVAQARQRLAVLRNAAR
jgi:tetratricopeptide (TPR) repeat protein